MAVAAILILMNVTESLSAQPGGVASKVVVSRVNSTRKSASKSFVGSLVPVKRSPIGSAVDGRVTKMFVEAGDAVTVDETQMVEGEPLGQPLVQLRTVSLDIEIAAAQAELRLRQQAETELQKSLPTEIKGASAAVKEIEARLEFSEANKTRLKGLNNSDGGVSDQEVHEAVSTYLSQLQLKIGVETLLNKLTETSDSRLLQARVKVEAQEIEIRRLMELKEKYTIRAPFPGYVTAKNTELGQWVGRGDTVLEMIQLDPIELVVPVPQEFIQSLEESIETYRANNEEFKVRVSVDKLPEIVAGEVVSIIPQADLRSRSFPVKIRIKNPLTEDGHLLKAGMIARAWMFLGNDEDTLLVLKDALVLDASSTSLYVVDRVLVNPNDPTDKNVETRAKRIQVRIGASIGNWIQVKGLDDDIEKGDQVVILGNERLRAGQKIAVTEELPDTLADALEAVDPSTKK